MSEPTTERISDEELATVELAGVGWCGERLFAMLCQEIRMNRAAIAERDAAVVALVAALRPFAATFEAHGLSSRGFPPGESYFQRAAEVYARCAALAERWVGDAGEGGDDA